MHGFDRGLGDCWSKLPAASAGHFLKCLIQRPRGLVRELSQHGCHGVGDVQGARF